MVIKTLGCGCSCDTRKREFNLACTHHINNSQFGSKLEYDFGLFVPLTVGRKINLYIDKKYKEYAEYLQLDFLPKLFTDIVKLEKFRLSTTGDLSERNYKYACGASLKVFTKGTRDLIKNKCSIYINVLLHKDIYELNGTIMHELLHYKYKDMNDGDEFDKLVDDHIADFGQRNEPSSTEALLKMFE